MIKLDLNISLAMLYTSDYHNCGEKKTDLKEMQRIHREVGERTQLDIGNKSVGSSNG